MGRLLTSVTAAAMCWATAAAYAQSPPPPAAPAAPASTPAAARAADDSVVLNFEGADIREVIHSLADALAINYQIDPRIQGQVTIRTTGTIAKQDLFPVFNQILRSNGISAVLVGDIYQIIPVAEAKTKAIIPNTATDRGRVRQQDAFVIEVVPVEHVAAQEMVNVIQPFVTPGRRRDPVLAREPPHHHRSRVERRALEAAREDVSTATRSATCGHGSTRSSTRTSRSSVRSYSRSSTRTASRPRARRSAASTSSRCRG